jgi:predicted dehydrogenase
MEWQMRNWYYFTWLSGDFNVEQHVHSLDKMAWAMNDEYPVRITGMGGRQTRTSPEYGHIYDHFFTVYEYKNGVKCFSSCRQQIGCDGVVNDYITGTKGICTVQDHVITGETKWQFQGKDMDMYQSEHNELFKSIREAKPINNGDYMAKSTMMAIAARMSAYTGKTLTWDQCMKSEEDLTPAKYEWGPMSVPPVAMPGTTRFK